MFKVGEKIFIRTVTFHLLGEITEKEGNWVRLKTATWVADSGNPQLPFHKSLETGELDEIEYVGDVRVNLATATDVFTWGHDLPTESK
jgi:hypothetical protein